MVRDELLQLRAGMAAEAATLARDLEALFAASRDSNADDEHDPEGATIGFERAQLTALLAAAPRWWPRPPLSGPTAAVTRSR